MAALNAANTRKDLHTQTKRMCVGGFAARALRTPPRVGSTRAAGFRDKKSASLMLVASSHMWPSRGLYQQAHLEPRVVVGNCLLLRVFQRT